MHSHRFGCRTNVDEQASPRNNSQKRRQRVRRQRDRGEGDGVIESVEGDNGREPEEHPDLEAAPPQDAIESRNCLVLVNQALHCIAQQIPA